MRRPRPRRSVRYHIAQIMRGGYATGWIVEKFSRLRKYRRCHIVPAWFGKRQA